MSSGAVVAVVIGIGIAVQVLQAPTFCELRSDLSIRQSRHVAHPICQRNS
jgi:hypothetical protein